MCGVNIYALAVEESCGSYVWLLPLRTIHGTCVLQIMCVAVTKGS